MDPEKFMILQSIFPMFAVMGVAISVGWVLTTWMRIKHGYPLDGAWGQQVHPHSDKEAIERIKLLSSENAQLRAELGSVKDRLETIERIVTDEPNRLAREIDQLQVGSRQ